MQTKYKLASRLIIAMLAMCTHFVYASDDSSNKSFEDGLTSHSYFGESDHSGRSEHFGKTFKEKEDENKFESDHYKEWDDFEHESHVTMVPEPETNAMLLVGLAVLLVAARRKQVFKRR